MKRSKVNRKSKKDAAAIYVSNKQATRRKTSTDMFEYKINVGSNQYPISELGYQ